jgi:hypothetical protein
VTESDTRPSFLGRLFPLRRAPDARSLDDLRAEYGRWDAISALVTTVAAAPLAYAWWRLFLAVAPGVGFASDGDVFSLRPTGVFWAPPAMLLGILCAAPILDQVLKRSLGPRYREYEEYVSLRNGFDSKRLAAPVFVVFGALAVVGALAIFDWHVRFAASEIRLDPLLGVGERTISYADVKAITTAPAFVAPIGRTVERRTYVLRFSDGSTWNTGQDPSGATCDDLRAVMETIAQRSGVPITEVPVLTRRDLS